MNEVDANNRINAHFSSQEKTKRSDFIIDNNGSMEETKRQVQELFLKISSPGKNNHD
jgi:dephospho-CoA kinase